MEQSLSRSPLTGHAKKCHPVLKNWFVHIAGEVTFHSELPDGLRA